MTTDIGPSRVLLVEDEFLLNMMLADALTEQGFEVHAVANAREALQHLTGGLPCDVLVTDINLGVGIDGMALARLARQLRPGLPVVYASGSVRRLEEIESVPGAIFFAKPYDPGRICAMLQRMTGTAH
jgi:CheY-like chemotaxis protein